MPIKGKGLTEERNNTRVRLDIPKFVMTIIERLERAGFEAYVVGGAVRDLCLKRPVMDWDVATSARPEMISEVFQDVRHFTLKHETVTLVDSDRHYEVTTYRGSGEVNLSIEEDLGHRDFTINAMAWDRHRKRILDPFGGREDIKKKIVRAVGKPEERFREDPLRLIRGVRIAVDLGFRIEEKTFRTMACMAERLTMVAGERIQDELMKILMSEKPSQGFYLMRRTGLLKSFLPELLEGYLKRQNAFHRFTIFRHIMETLDRVEPDPVLRLTALLHDIAKPRIRKRIDGRFSFLGHEKASSLLAEEIMVRLKFSRERIGKVTNLIAHHMIGYRPEWGDGAVRRLIRRVGPDDVERLLTFRRADLLAHGRNDLKMTQLSELDQRIKKMAENPFPLKTVDLAIDGRRVMKILDLNPGPSVGKVLDRLMDKVLDHPELNREERLVSLVAEMRGDQRGP